MVNNVHDFKVGDIVYYTFRNGSVFTLYPKVRYEIVDILTPGSTTKLRVRLLDNISHHYYKGDMFSFFYYKMGLNPRFNIDEVLQNLNILEQKLENGN